MPDRSDYDTLVTNPLVTQYVAEFIIKAGILGQFQAVETFTDCSDEEEPEALGEDDG